MMGADSAAVSLALATALAERYRIERELGAGGMATVYLARDRKHDRDVAIKVLRPDFAATIGAERFLAEIRLTARLQHAHIVPLFDSGESAGFLYYVMPYIEGESLRARLGRDTKLDVEAMLAIARPVAQALAYAHEHGVVHRDIKPENILLSKGQPFVTDFGIARAVTAASGGRLTATGLAIGTPAYMSPEQALGEGTVDARSDVYSLGCVIFEMLVGEPPFTGPTVQAVITRRLTGSPPHLAGVSAAIDEVVRKSLATAPQDRFATAIALADALVEAARKPATPEKSIVVLPFENLSPDPDNAFFADGLTEEIIAALAKVQSLRVISRTSAMLLRDSKKDVPTIAHDLNVRYALEGSVRRAGTSLRITTQLIDAAADTHLWAEKYSGTLDDVFDLQERLARNIVTALEIALAPDEDRRLGVRATSDPRVLEVWLRARQDAYRLTEEGVAQAIQLTANALTAFGDHALLYAADAVFHYFAYDFGFRHDEQTLDRCEASATRALEQNPDLPQALYAKGLARYKRRDLPSFVRYLRRAVEMERNGDTLGFLAFVLAEAGKTAEAARYADEACERDPLSMLPQLGRATVDLFDGRCDLAVARLRAWDARELGDHAFTCWWLGQALTHAGDEDEAVAAFARGARANAGLLSDMCELGVRSFQGNGAEARAWFESKDNLQQAAVSDETFPRFVSECFARFRDFDEALRWIEQAISWGFTNHRFLSQGNLSLAPLRGDARFEALIERARAMERKLPT